MASARAAIAVLQLDKLFFIPAAIPPHKALPAESATAMERLAMSELMADGLANELGRPDDITAVGLELRREGKSYTADTLAELHTLYPEDELWLLMGTDMFLTLQSWHAPEEIMALAGIAAFARAEGDGGMLLTNQAQYLQEKFGARVMLIELPQITDISSTLLRQALQVGEGSEYLWPQVYGYLLRNHLYGVTKDLKNLSVQELRCVSYSMIRAKRIAHVRGAEQAAVELAHQWGGDPEKARKAAILHDCTKYLSGEEQLGLCRKYGEELDELERNAVKLLHAKTGAWVSRDWFGVDDEIFNAIFWHTTGKPNMTLLEKIIYLADYMEPTRNFPGVEKLRSLAQTDLDAAVLLGFEMSIQEMTERGLPVHHNTAEARAWMLHH